MRILIPFIFGACSLGCLIASVWRKSLALSLFGTALAVAGFAISIQALNVDAQLYLLSSGLTVGFLFAAWQALRLRKAYRSKSSLIGAIAFLLLLGRQLYSLIRLRANLRDARAQGIIFDHLSGEQWLIVVWAYAIMLCFVLWQHRQYKDLKRLGIV